MDGLVEALRSCVGDEHVLIDPDVRRSYETDWTGRFTGSASAVVRPGGVEEVRNVLGICASGGVAVVTQGGNTGLVGGSVPLRGGIVLSTTRFKKRGLVNRENRTVSVGAGVTLADVQRHCAANNMRFAVDIAARDTATIGGMFATNACGINHFRFGGMRENVVSFTAVLGDGSLAGPEKKSLLCGSEGALGVVTEVTLSLLPTVADHSVIIASFPDAKSAISTAGVWRNVKSVESIELFTEAGMSLVCDAFRLPRPVAPAQAYLLADLAAPVNAISELMSTAVNVIDSAIGESEAECDALWRYREYHTLAINSLGPPLKFDVRVPMDRCADFLNQVTARVAHSFPQATTISFGHICDGNLHVNVMRTADQSCEEIVYTCVEEHGGSAVAEHGVGSLKAQRYLAALRPAEKARYAEAKKYCDPLGIMNPGVAFSVTD